MVAGLLAQAGPTSIEKLYFGIKPQNLNSIPT